MCKANDLPISLKSNTFNALCTDFDQVTRATLQGMSDTGQDTAEINVKVKITLTPDSAPDYTVKGIGQQTRSITKPKFDHTVTAVIQRKEKKTGTLSGNYELVWDRESCCFVMRPIDDGQSSLFDGEQPAGEQTELRALPGGVIDAEFTEVAAGGQDADDLDQRREAFNWLKNFIDADMTVMEAMGNYTVRDKGGKVILSSGTGTGIPFYAAAETLEPHVGHPLTCTEGPDSIVIMCEDCDTVIFRMGDPDAVKDDPQEPDAEGHEDGAEEPGNGLDHPGDGEYPYEESSDPYGGSEAEEA